MAKNNLIIRPRLVVMILILIVGLFSLQYFKQELMLQEKTTELMNANQTLQEKKTYNRELEKTIEYYQSDEYKEEIKQREIDKVNNKIVIFKEK